MKLQILGLSLLGVLAAANSSLAETSSASAPAAVAPASAAASTVSIGDFLQKVRKNTSGTYQMWFRGSSFQSLSGNVDGSGTNLKMTHYFNLTYKVGSKWRVGVTQPFTQSIDEVPAGQADPFVANDPYLSISNPRIWTSKRYGTNLYGQIRYYAPLSRASSQAVDRLTATEAGNGTVRLYLAPSKTWLDGALSLNLQTLLYYRMSSYSASERAARKAGNPDRVDMTFIFDPVVGYAFTDTVEGYFEYAFSMNHNTTGHWGKWKDNDYISVGANVQVGKKLLLNPYLDAAPRRAEFKNTGVGLQAIYSFL